MEVTESKMDMTKAKINHERNFMPIRNKRLIIDPVEGLFIEV